MTRLYPRGRGTKDSSASFSSSLCSRFVKNDNKQLGKIYEKRKTGLVTPPPSLVHYSKKGTYPGNPVPPNQAGQTPDPGQVLGSLKGDPFSLISSSSKVALGISSLSFQVPRAAGFRRAACCFAAAQVFQKTWGWNFEKTAGKVLKSARKDLAAFRSGLLWTH